VIGAEGEQLGIMTPDDARDVAEEAGLDLVEVASTAKPPVCRIMDYGKYKYEQSKKQSGSKVSKVELKTITMRPKTDTHDIETKTRRAREFLAKGDRVKFVMRLRGREHAHKDLWFIKLATILESLSDVSTISQRPQEEGRTITAGVEPSGKNAPPPAEK
jgi:translation initiation factor IF-3